MYKNKKIKKNSQLIQGLFIKYNSYPCDDEF